MTNMENIEAEKAAQWVKNLRDTADSVELAFGLEKEIEEPKMCFLLKDIDLVDKKIGEIIYILPHDRVVTLWEVDGELVPSIYHNSELIKLS